MTVPRKAAALAAAAAAATIALSACGSTQLGAAAVTGNSRITTEELTSQVANLNAAYQQDKATKISAQQPTGQEAQQVLTWLIRFKIYDEIARQHHITVTPAQVNNELYGPGGLSAEARQDKVNINQYVSAGGALPPDLKPQLGRYFVILMGLESKLAGGKTPATQAQQTQLTSQVTHQQCLASKSLGVRVNPQYGQFDYSSYTVVPGQSALAADPNPSPTAAPSPGASPQAPVKTSPPC